MYTSVKLGPAELHDTRIQWVRHEYIVKCQIYAADWNNVLEYKFSPFTIFVLSQFQVLSSS
jgi:hypothetical protein